MASTRTTASYLRTLHLLRTPRPSSISLADLLLSRQSRNTFRRIHLSPLRQPKRPFSTTRPRLADQKPFNPTPNLNSPSLSLTQRLKKLSREYGWAAFGVYMALTALDLPLCFLAVRSIGTEKVGVWEHAVVEWVRKAVPFQVPEKWQVWKRADGSMIWEGFGKGKEGEGDGRVGERVGDKVEQVEMELAGYDHGVREAEELNQGDNASIWTQLALAYAIHKSFIFIRVPITAAITPKVVKTLRGWGWNIGKRRPKAERIAAKEARKVSKP